MEEPTLLKRAKLIAILAFAWIGCASNAAAYVAGLTKQFSGDPLATTGARTPWVTFSFLQLSANSVQVKFSATGLTDNQRVESLYFNLAGLAPGAKTPSLTFTPVSGPAATSIGFKGNEYKADGAGYFDIRFTFDTKVNAHGQPNSNVFTQGQNSIYTITGTGLKTASFSDLSSPTNSKGTGGSNFPAFYAAGKILHASSGGSSWVSAAPEPELYAMMLVGFGLVGFITRRRRNSKGTAA